MEKGLKWKFFLIVGICALSVYLLYPIGESLNLGLDLRGGVYLVYRVDDTKLPDDMQESEAVAGAAEEQAAELNEVTSRTKQLKRYARPLGDILERFETDAEHEFVFSGGPSQTTRTPGDEE